MVGMSRGGWWKAAILALFASVAQASPVAYQLTLNNIDTPALPDGTPYVLVSIDDTSPNTIMFTVTLLPALSSLAGSNFGIDNFAFNLLAPGSPVLGDSPSAQWGLPAGWSANVAPPPNQADGFGRFDAQVDGTGQSRLTTLVFYLYGTGLTAQDFAKTSSNGNGQGNVFFAAHVAGFVAPGNITSGYFGGSMISNVPVPAAVWLLLSGIGGMGAFARRRKAVIVGA